MKEEMKEEGENERVRCTHRNTYRRGRIAIANKVNREREWKYNSSVCCVTISSPAYTTMPTTSVVFLRVQPPRRRLDLFTGTQLPLSTLERKKP